MNIYDAWSTFLETGSIMDYLRYTSLRDKQQIKEDFPEYLNSKGTFENKGEQGEDTN